MRALLLGLLVLTSLFVAASRSPAQTAEWGWFSAVSAIDKWYVAQGKATVEIIGKRLTAKLLRDDGTVHIALSGSIQNGQVTVTATEMDSDSPLRKLRGNLKTTKWTDGPGGRRAILMTEIGEPGGLVVGLTKELK